MIGHACPKVLVEQTFFPAYDEAKELLQYLMVIHEYQLAIAAMDTRFFAIIKTYRNPPVVIKGVFEACYKLFGYEYKDICTHAKVMRLTMV